MDQGPPWETGAGERDLIFLNAFYRPGWIVAFGPTCPLYSSIPEGRPGDLGRTQATSAGAALPTISNHLVETLKGRKKKACVQHSEDLLLRLCSQQQRLQQCFPVQRRPDGDGVVAVGVGGGAASASASEPAFFSLLQLGPTTLGTMAILAMAMATLTPTATHRMHTHTLTVMGIAAFTPVMGITRAIDTEVTTLTAEPIIDTRATILIAGRGGRLTQRQLNDAERPPTAGCVRTERVS